MSSITFILLIMFAVFLSTAPNDANDSLPQTKPEVMDDGLRETVDLVMDLKTRLHEDEKELPPPLSARFLCSYCFPKTHMLSRNLAESGGFYRRVAGFIGYLVMDLKTLRRFVSRPSSKRICSTADHHLFPQTIGPLHLLLLLYQCSNLLSSTN